MCIVLKISRSTYYYELQKSEVELQLDNHAEDVIRIFKSNRKAYGTRRIKRALAKEGVILSRCRIRRIMRENALVSSYTIAHYKHHKSPSNNDSIDNIVEQKFDNREVLDVVVSDLTYVKVGGKWNYVCLILDLHNREIIGFSAGRQKSADLVFKAFATIKYDLRKIEIFHTDRGNEFKNHMIENLLDTFEINRSLSKKGYPYDNAVAEATYKTFKVEFAYPIVFESLDDLKLELYDYVNWYNNHRLHLSLGYLSPTDYKALHLKKIV